jgi:hypothetical protein
VSPAQVAHIMELVMEYAAKRSSAPQSGKENLAAYQAIEAALRDAPQAEPNDAKDAARYRYLVVMETKAAPDTVAHYIRNPAHLDRVIEVMEQKP